MVTDDCCPWCEAQIEPELDAVAQTCPECLTTWAYEEVRESELALAA
jgi:predicted RNA-binding Zn-ribbon protein involved in translation (DUF1610 family)